MNECPLPRFIIIGAAKAATTWIAHQLRERPDVFMPGPEPHYFSREYGRGPAWYAEWFADAKPGQLVGEKSADYLADPDAAQRIAHDLGSDVQLIVQLRNPVERAYSDYCMLYRRGTVGDDIDACLDRDRTREPRFLDDGLYARHLGRFLDHFPAERLKVVLHDEIRADPVAVIRDLTGLLGLPARPVAAPAARVNDGASALVPLALRRLPQPVKDLVAPLRGNPVFDRVRGAIARPVRYPPLDDKVRARLSDFYRDDIGALERMLGRDLGGWTRPARA